VRDTIVIVGLGGVLFAKRSDRDPSEAQAIEWHPREIYRTGTELAGTWTSIPQDRGEPPTVPGCV